MVKKTVLERAKERYAEARDATREQDLRIREDLRFSNPAAPEQWDNDAQKARKGRPMLVLDRTNQFIAQVVNDARQNKPSIQVLPVDSKADKDVAQQLNGIIRHIEYTSRAGIAYDTAIELSARVGLGWLCVVPRVVRPETNEQEIIIQREHDPLAIRLDPNSVEPDGSDAMWGFREATLTTRAFEAAWPKAQKADWDSEGWFGEDSVRVAEYFEVIETKENRIVTVDESGGRLVQTEDEYWDTARARGVASPVSSTFAATKRSVKWYKLTGAEVLEGTDFPSQWVPLIPVLGHEMWVDGKRYLCGMVRRLMDGQRFHNYEMSALTEVLMSQPKAPFIMSERAFDGHEDEWQALNSGNPVALTYNDIDEQGQPIASPIRLSPPMFPAAYAQGAQLGVAAMEASVGMYKSNLGQQSNAVSGRAKLADQREGDTANFHYVDNLRRSMEHMGRIIVAMIPPIMDTPRQAKILGEDGEQTEIDINPEMPEAVAKQNGKLIAINPGVGAYDVRVKVGPSYTSMRTEASQRLVELSQGNPALGAALAPLLVKLNDMPEAEKIAKVAIALLPPNVQKVYADDDSTDIPDAVKAQLDQQEQQMQAMAQAMDQAGAIIKDLQAQLEAKNDDVKDEAKLAMAEIKAAQADLERRAVQLDSARTELEQAKRIASLELQLEAEKIKEAGTQEPQAAPKEDSGEMVQAAIDKMAESILGNMTTRTLERTNSALAELHGATAGVFEGLQDVADMVAAPRDIAVRRGADGLAEGATSTMTLPVRE